MKRLQRAALIVEMLDRIIEKGSWAGETHLQKCLFFLQTMRRVPTEFRFQIYKYGPYSFDLHDEFIRLQAEMMIDYSPRSSGYGASFDPCPRSRILRDHFPKTLERYKDDIDFVVDHFGDLYANELGKLGTAYFLHLENGNSSDYEIGREINSIKPHIAVSEGTRAAEEVRAIERSICLT